MEIFLNFLKYDKIINYFLLIFLIYISLYFGLIISHYTQEELKPGLKYFFFMKLVVFFIILNLFISSIFNFLENLVRYIILSIINFSLFFYLGFYTYKLLEKFFRLVLFFLKKKIKLKELDSKINNFFQTMVEKNIQKILVFNNFIYSLFSIILFEFINSEAIIIIFVFLFFYGLSYSSIIGFYLKELKLLEKIKFFFINSSYFLIIPFFFIILKLFI